MKRKLLALAKKHGVIVVRVSGGSDDPTIELLAPDGHLFDGNGTHSLLCFDWADALARLQAEIVTLKSCDDAGCDCDRSKWNLATENVVR